MSIDIAPLLVRNITQEQADAWIEENHTRDGYERVLVDILRRLQRDRRSRCSDLVLHRLCEKTPELTHVGDDVPLHEALCIRGIQPLSLGIYQLLSKAPGALTTPDKEGNLALHLALRLGAPAEAVLFIFRTYPDACRVPAHDGAMPLHLFAQYRRREVEAEVREVLEAAPEALRHPDARGRLPLHCFTSDLRSVQIQATIRLLLSRYPEACLVPDDSGRLPLHHAMDGVAHVGPIVEDIFLAAPEAVRARDNEQCLPLHYGIERIPDDLRTRMLAEYPDAVHVVNARGDTVLSHSLEHQKAEKGG